MNPNSVRFFTHDELKRLLAAAQQASPRNYAMILLAYRHALRASEICNLRISDVDLGGAQILCRRGKNSVTNWQRMAADEKEALHPLLKDRGGVETKYVFVSRSGKPIGRQHFHRIIQKLGAAAGIPSAKCHPHALKHSAGTHLANAGVPVQVIQHRLGHKSVSNTMVYLTIASGYVDQAFEEALAKGAVV